MNSSEYVLDYPRIKRGNLEFRWTQGYPEVVVWAGDPEYCYTLGYWQKDSEGWSFKNCGPRPFNDDTFEHNTFWELCRMGDKIANAIWGFEEWVNRGW